MEAKSESANRNFDLSIYNNLGQVVLRMDDYFMGEQIDLQNMPSGLYFVNLIDSHFGNRKSISFFK